MAKIRDIVDVKARDTIPNSGLGHVVNEQAWGAATATKRYGGGTRTFAPPKDECYPQFQQDQPLDKTYNDVPHGDWRRDGAGESKPGYVPGYRGGRR
jgi:hypothetical protein